MNWKNRVFMYLIDHDTIRHWVIEIYTRIGYGYDEILDVLEDLGFGFTDSNDTI